MKEFLTNYLVPSGVLLTFVASLVTIYITRINARSSKYIDTVTSERIKWIEKIRFEISELNAELIYTIRSYITLAGNNYNPDQDVEKQVLEFRSIAQKRTFAYSQLEKISEIDIIKKINTVRLRLNPVEDVNIVAILDALSSFILGEEKNEENITKSWNLNNDLMVLTQKMLKDEWEKVKREAKNSQ